MIRSMTGFGKGVAQGRLGRVKIEIKSLNYKFFEVGAKLPPNLSVFEDSVREYLQRKVSRGRITLFLGHDKGKNAEDEVYIDKTVAKKYYNMMLSLKKSLRLGGEITLEQIMPLQGVVSYQPQEEDAEKLWPLIRRALSEATTDLIESQTREGRTLKRNLQQIVRVADESLRKVKRRAPAVVKDYKKKLLKNIRTLTGAKRIFSPEKIEEEAAIFARNCDISEETHRLAAHIASFKKALANHGEVGRRLDFIAQEMYREANTIGAKANDFFISKEVIKIKSHIEKIREQAQNVE